MIDTKLIMVEGIPGSGKSTTAFEIKKYFDSINIPARLYLESDCCNPSDYAWISVIDGDDYARLIKDYPEYDQVLKEYTEKDEGYILVLYQKMRTESGVQLPDGIMSFLNSHEPYDGRVPLDKFQELHLNRYLRFSGKAAKMEGINIFESSFLQNQVNELLIFHDISRDLIVQYLCRLAQNLKALKPVLIYLSQPDVSMTLRRAADERRSRDKSLSPDWIDYVINYISGSLFGRKNNLQGFEGAAEYFRRRKEVEMEAIRRVDMKTIIIENGDYDAERGISKVIEAISDLWECGGL